MSEENGEANKELDPAFEHILEMEVEKTQASQVYSEEEVNDLLFKLHITKKNKGRAEIIDKLSKYSSYAEVKLVLLDSALEDKYQFCRAKAVSILADYLDDKDVRRVVLQKLDDKSVQVRLWAIWALRGIVEEKVITEILIGRLKYKESSNKVKLWIVRALSDQINYQEVQDAFLYILKSKPNKEMKKLILYYLLQKIDNLNIRKYISSYIHNEYNREIRIELVKSLLKFNEDSDVRYNLEKLSKNERDEEIKRLLVSYQ
ncbi:MAG: HEAT repeat domain-containing protein [Candidatus Heimdallarchaeaceae archaeon]